MTIAAHDEPKGARALAGKAIGWWLGELGGLCQDLARLVDFGRDDAVTVEAGERYWIVRQRQRPLGQIDGASLDPQETRRALARIVPHKARRAILVEIPRERVMAKRIVLPAVGRSELERILHFEVARHFPFPAERVYFRHRVVGRGEGPGARGTIEVELVAVPREVVAEICGALADAGLRPGWVSVAGGKGDSAFRLPAIPAGRVAGALARADKAFLVSLALFVLAAIVSPLLHQRVRLEAIEREAAALRPEAQAVLDARERQRRETERTAAPLRLRAARPPLVVTLDALSRAVPDGAWLQSLNISGRDIVMSGLAASAAATALALEQGHTFADVVFRSPITRDPTTGLEHFQLSAEIAETAR